MASRAQTAPSDAAPVTALLPIPVRGSVIECSELFGAIREATPVEQPALDLSDMDRVHRLVASDRLADIFTRITRRAEKQ